jgi:hypothetical protein
MVAPNDVNGDINYPEILAIFARLPPMPASINVAAFDVVAYMDYIRNWDNVYVEPIMYRQQPHDSGPEYLHPVEQYMYIQHNGSFTRRQLIEFIALHVHTPQGITIAYRVLIFYPNEDRCNHHWAHLCRDFIYFASDPWIQRDLVRYFYCAEEMDFVVMYPTSYIENQWTHIRDYVNGDEIDSN